MLSRWFQAWSQAWNQSLCRPDRLVEQRPRPRLQRHAKAAQRVDALLSQLAEDRRSWLRSAPLWAPGNEQLESREKAHARRSTLQFRR